MENAKELHGLRFGHILGIRNMYEYSCQAAAVQNMKRIAKAFRFFSSVAFSCAKAMLSSESMAFFSKLQ